MEINGYEVRDFFDVLDNGESIEGLSVTLENGDVYEIEGETLSDFEDEDEEINEDDLINYIEENLSFANLVSE